MAWSVSSTRSTVRNAQQWLRADFQRVLPPSLGGDMAAMRGIAKFLLQWEREAQAKGEPPVFDHAFIAEHTSGIDGYLAAVDATA